MENVYIFIIMRPLILLLSLSVRASDFLVISALFSLLTTQTVAIHIFVCDSHWLLLIIFENIIQFSGSSSVVDFVVQPAKLHINDSFATE